jgi:hypothetical protein
MSSLKKWRGLKALVQDVVVHGSRAVERVHMETARRPFAILEQVPPIATPTRVIHTVHDVAVTTTYSAVRLVTRVVGATVDVALDAIDDDEP